MSFHFIKSHLGRKLLFLYAHKQIATMIFAWLSKNLEGCENPRIHGKGLVADKKGIWRYRVGDYRLLAHIFDDRLIILVVDASHRKDIYK